MPESREARQDSALAALLEALPVERRTRVLGMVGIEAERVSEADQKRDPRRCVICDQGYVRCRQLNEKTVDVEAKHEWKPDRNRAGEPL